MNELLAVSKAQVLAIDDDQEVLEQLTLALSSAGYSCHCCHNYEAALDLLHGFAPDLIISDINLAGHSGLTMCEQLRRDEGLFDVPLMFLSDVQIPDVIRRSNAGCGTYYLRKPFDPQVLLELVDKALWTPQRGGCKLVTC